MIKLKKVLAGTMAAAMMFTAVGCGMIEKTEKGIANTVVAKVYGTKITLGEVDENLGSVTTQLVTAYGENYKTNDEAMTYLKNQRTSVLNTLINDVIFDKKAQEFGIMPSDEELNEQVNSKLEEVKSSFESDDAYQQALTSAGITEDQLLKELRLSAISQTVYDYVVKDVTVTDEDIQTEYNNNQTSYTESPNKADISHILLKTEDEANAVIERLNNGEDFAEVAKEVSTDTTSGANGGALGWIEYTSTQYDQTFLMAAISLEKGTYSSAPVQTQFGYHVIKCNDKEEYPVKPLADVKDEIEQKLLQDAQYKTWSDTVTQWQDEAKYKIYDDKLSQ